MAAVVIAGLPTAATRRSVGVRVPVGTVVSVTVPVGADDGTAVLTDEIAVDSRLIPNP